MKKQHRLENRQAVSEVLAVQGDMSHIVEQEKRKVRKQIRSFGLAQDGPVHVEIEIRAWALASD